MVSDNNDRHINKDVESQRLCDSDEDILKSNTKQQSAKIESPPSMVRKLFFLFFLIPKRSHFSRMKDLRL